MTTIEGMDAVEPTEFGLLGYVEAVVHGVPVDLGHSRQRCVFAVLLAEANRPVSVTQLLDRVWADRHPKHPRAALSGYLSRLRTLFAGLPHITLARVPEGYRVTVDPDRVDLHRYRRLVAEARSTDDAAVAVKVFNEALREWRGEAFATLDTPWFVAARKELEADRLAATLDRNDAALDLGWHADLLAELILLADQHPFDERLAGQLMLALYRSGRQADALYHFDRLRMRLADELGADPGPELRALHGRILRTDASLVPPEANAVRGTRDAVIVPRQLPAAPSSFVGRARELADLDASISAERTRMVIHAIWGAPGVGKTTLALRWAHRAAYRFDDGQLYLNLRGFDPGAPAMTASEALLVLLDALGVSARQAPVGVDAQAALYRSLLAGKRVLLVLDNARDADHVRPLLPGTAGCAVIVTSRTRLTGLLVGEGAHPISLDVLTTDESRALLADRLGLQRAAAAPEAVDEIVAQCAGLPLALAIVAARVTAQPNLTLDGVAAELRKATDPVAVLADTEPTVDVRAVFSWSYHRLRPDTARLFRLLGLHPSPQVGLAAAASLAGTTVDAVHPLLAELARAHLVTEPTPRRFLLHNLIHAYAGALAGELDEATERGAATVRMLDYYLHSGHTAAVAIHPHRHPIVLPPPAAGTQLAEISGLEQARAWFTSEHDTLLAAIPWAARHRFDRHAWQLASTLSDYLDREGYRQQGLAVHETALQAARRLGDTAAEAAVLRAMGRVSSSLHRFDDAEAHYRQALDLYRGMGDQFGQGQAHLGISWVLEHQGCITKAIEHDQRALDLFGAANHTVGRARALNHLGSHRMIAGDYRQALDDCQAALTLFRRLDDQLGEAATQDSIGQAYLCLGQHAEAVDRLRHSAHLLRELGDRYNEAHVLIHLGDAYRDAGRSAAGTEAWRRAESLLRELDHPDAEGVRVRLTTTAGT
jgi:DNA-binding SARP family transcriptional activator/tetratricopeptide (TPR) repeat protein